MHRPSATVLYSLLRSTPYRYILSKLSLPSLATPLSLLMLAQPSATLCAQGTALFKLRITSLSSHRDKQRFRIRVSPVETGLLLKEPGSPALPSPRHFCLAGCTSVAFLLSSS